VDTPPYRGSAEIAKQLKLAGSVFGPHTGARAIARDKLLSEAVNLCLDRHDSRSPWQAGARAALIPKGGRVSQPSAPRSLLTMQRAYTRSRESTEILYERV
jgi:hypothetical protein